MANTALELSSLDFDTLKSNFKTFLSTQSVFKDYNFEGSNINVLLDVMSYNTYLNSFYLNMIASEMFMDSAQNIDSVISHAKELNYTPHSAKSSKATLSFNVITSTPSPLNIRKGTRFSGTNANGNYTFVTNEDYSFTSSNNTFNVSGLSIYEGKYITDNFVYDITNEAQRFLLSNKNVDTDSLEVIVTENGINTTFSKADNLFGLNDRSSVYFLQGAENSQYEIIFGNGLFGRNPINLSNVKVNYRITNGTDADGITSFICNQDLGVMNGGTASIQIPIVVTSNSSGGSNYETIDSIKFSGPRYFATQQRAISSDDYSSLILSNFSGIIADVNVYGGELLEPKQYGRVVLALKPSTGTIAPEYIKNRISEYLKPYIALPNRIVITDPDYLYVKIDTTVQYNKTITSKTDIELKTIIMNNLIQYGKDHIEAFGSDLRYSKIVYHIDASDSSITSNDTKIEIIKRLTPLLNYPTSFNFSFNNHAEIEPLSPGYSNRTPLYDEPVITSSSFTYVSEDNSEYPLSYIRDDNFGSLLVYTIINNVFTILKNNIGTIDYSTGNVTINKLKTSFYGNYINLYLTPLNKDIIVNNNKIILLDPSDVNIQMIPTIN